jgi:hypothetical protein
MSNEITINVDEIRKLPDGSVINPELIRQIALYTNQTGDVSLTCKIRSEFMYAGLYPEIQKQHDIK